MRATALTEPGPVDGPLSATAATPAGRSTATGDPHTNWTERRGPVTYIYGPGIAAIEQVNLSSGTITYLAADRLGSVRATVNAGGSLTNTTSYDAWGNPQTAGGLTSNTPFGYAGNYTDSTGLTYNIGRYYDPQSGQFISVDPAVDQTEAPYAYVNGDPVDAVDPLGLGCFLDICTHSFDPMASLDAVVNIGRGATFGLTDQIANWIVPGASCTVPQDSLDQFIGSAATTLLGGEALGALLRSGRLGELLADETGSIGPGADADVRGKIPDEWGPGQPAKTGGGWRWIAGKGDYVRVDPGNPASPDPLQRVPHVHVTSNGRLVADHLPLSDWLTWSSWNMP